jgi:hypothetical protein
MNDLTEMPHSLALKSAYRQLTLATEQDLAGFEAKPADCHGNVERWVLLYPQHTIVRGFLRISESVFNKHCVIDTGRPKLLDITPRPQNEFRSLLSFIELRVPFDAMPNQVIWTQS